MSLIFRRARSEDVPKIRELQEGFLLSNLKKTFSENEIAGKGFFVYGLGENEFTKFLEGTKNYFYVAEANYHLVGYAIACDFSSWLSGEETWLASFQCEETVKELLVSKRVFYLKYICRKNGFPGVGQALFDELIIQAKTNGFEYVLDEVCNKRVENKASKIFQDKNGLKRIGFEVDKNGFEWAFFLKKI